MISSRIYYLQLHEGQKSVLKLERTYIFDLPTNGLSGLANGVLRYLGQLERIQGMPYHVELVDEKLW